MTLVPVHVGGAVVAIVTGFVALYVRKGATLHRNSGTIFVYAMLIMALSGAVMAIGRAGAALNIPAGLITAYLVVTALATVRAPSASRRLERGAMVAAVALGLICAAAAAALFARGGGRNMALAFPLSLFALVALLAAAGDVRAIRAGRLQGPRRLRRHLWRMCFALFIASGSFFLGPVRRIPVPLRNPAFRLIPFVVLVTMVYWLWRVRRARISGRTVALAAPEAHLT